MIGFSRLILRRRTSSPVQKEVRVSKKEQQAPPIMEDTTECNYVVMFFIVGVIALAAMDSVKK